MTETNWKAKYKSLQKKFNKAQPYFDTMARHNDRLKNANNAMKSTVETFRAKIEMLCPHKQEWIVPERQAKWGDEERHYCHMCYSYVVAEDINRKI